MPGKYVGIFFNYSSRHPHENLYRLGSSIHSCSLLNNKVCKWKYFNNQYFIVLMQHNLTSMLMYLLHEWAEVCVCAIMCYNAKPNNQIGLSDISLRPSTRYLQTSISHVVELSGHLPNLNVCT